MKKVLCTLLFSALGSASWLSPSPASSWPTFAMPGVSCSCTGLTSSAGTAFTIGDSSDCSACTRDATVVECYNSAWKARNGQISQCESQSLMYTCMSESSACLGNSVECLAVRCETGTLCFWDAPYTNTENTLGCQGGYPVTLSTCIRDTDEAKRCMFDGTGLGRYSENPPNWGGELSYVTPYFPNPNLDVVWDEDAFGSIGGWLCTFGQKYYDCLNEHCSSAIDAGDAVESCLAYTDYANSLVAFGYSGCNNDCGLEADQYNEP